MDLFVWAVRPQSVELMTSSGETLNVDVGQLISSWDILADEEPPMVSFFFFSFSKDGLSVAPKSVLVTGRPNIAGVQVCLLNPDISTLISFDPSFAGSSRYWQRPC